MPRYSTFSILLGALLIVIAGVTVALLGVPFAETTDDETLLTTWTSETETSIAVNHHEPAVTHVDGRPVIAAPLNGESGTDECRLEGLDPNGESIWRANVAPDACSIHSVGDVETMDLTGNGRGEFVFGTGANEVRVVDAETGTDRQQYDLDSFGYAKPTLAVGETGERTLVAPDFEGTVHGFDPDGDLRWEHELDGSIWAQPIPADVSGDGDEEVIIGHGTPGQWGSLTAIDGEREHWRANLTGPVLDVTRVNHGEAVTVVAATRSGEITAVDATNGEERWTRTETDQTSVGATANGTVYAASADGSVIALDVEDGSVTWDRQLLDEPANVLPAPILADVTGDGHDEVVAFTSEGAVKVLDLESGETLAATSVERGIYTSATAADVDGDDREEVLVLRGDGRVVALSYETAS